MDAKALYSGGQKDAYVSWRRGRPASNNQACIEEVESEV